MPVGQSVPLSAPVAAVAGFLGGELSRFIIKKFGGGEFAQRFATAVGHGLSSAAAGYVVNAVMADAIGVGGAVTTVQSIGTAVLHDQMRYGSFPEPALTSVR